MLRAANGSLQGCPVVLVVAATVTLLILVPPESRADAVTVITIAEDSGFPGCETTRSCLDLPWATVTKGGTIMWKNPTYEPHAMISGVPFSEEDTFDTGLIRPAESAALELDTLGLHQYYCQFHPWIAGFIHVTDAPIAEYDPPLRQYDRGVYPEYITCKESRHLAYKMSDASPMCLKEPSLKKFAERGLAIPADIRDAPSRIEAYRERFAGLLADYIGYDDAVITTDNIDDLKEYAGKIDYKERVLSRIQYEIPHGGILGLQNSRSEESAEVLQRHASTPYAEYSQTNIQVPGVDESDFVKNDADSIYVIAQNDDVAVVDIGDAGRALTPGISPHVEGSRHLLLHQDVLAVLSYDNDDGSTTVTLLDVSSGSAVLAEISLDSELRDARMIGDTIYIMTRSDIDKPPTLYDRLNDEYYDAYRAHLFENNTSYDGLHTITAIPVYDASQARSYSFVLGGFDTVYVSRDSVYISNTQEYDMHEALFADGLFFRHAVRALEPYELAQLHSIAADGDIDGMAEFVLDSFDRNDAFGLASKLEAGEAKAFDLPAQETWFVQYLGNLPQPETRAFDLPALDLPTQETAIHKIAIDGVNLKHVASGLVDGVLIDSFALNEGEDGMLRVITSTRDNGLQTNVYTLDEGMSVVGSLEGIAPGETLHSARFSGDWLYAVTFRQVDPFFVIDVSGTEPKVLGVLKIPGYSEYLQNYDDTHVIGIGRDTNQNMFDATEDAGVKISMFDVSDFENPREVQSIIVGDHSTDSAGLVEHKSLLIDDNKGILSIPIRFGGELFFYVYSVNDDYTMDMHSKIPHVYDKSNPHHMRSLYIGDVLYTITPKMIKANDLLQRDVSIGSLDI